jgi:hypothetical protein
MRPDSRDVRKRDGRSIAVGVGIVLVALGLAINPWTLARVFSPDGSFEHPLIVLTIAGFEALLVGCGIALLALRPKVGTGDLVATAMTAALLLAGIEVLVRWAYRQDDLMYATAQRSESLGWETRPDFRLTRAMGNYGTVDYSTAAHGFRRFGNPSATRPRILVIGDSYTDAAQVSDGGTYYDYLADSAVLDVEVFAYGTGAYGSLQEFLILDRYIDEIRPDLILWQFCSNDLINNYRPLEARSLYENSWRRRPYLEEGEIRIRAPTMHWLPQLSRTAQLVAARRALVHAERAKVDPSARQSIEAELTPDHALVDSAKVVTVEIMRRVRERAGATPVVAFNVDRPAWLGQTYERVAAAADIGFIGGVPELIELHRSRGEVIDGITNGHWNARGHGLVGRLLADSLTARALLPAASPTGTQVAAR